MCLKIRSHNLLRTEVVGQGRDSRGAPSVGSRTTQHFPTKGRGRIEENFINYSRCISGMFDTLKDTEDYNVLEFLHRNSDRFYELYSQCLQSFGLLSMKTLVTGVKTSVR